MIAALRKRFGRAPAPRPAGTIALASRSHVGKVRTVNEDRILARSDAGLLAVADGMGGHGFGDRAAAMAIEVLDDWATTGLATADDLRAAIGTANREIRECFSGKSGSTLAGLWIGGAGATVFWVGDSRVYRLRDRAFDLLTHDHSYVQELVDAGTLDAAAAGSHPRANLITRAVGIDGAVEVDMRAIDIRPGDTYLICSDGLSGCVSPNVLDSACRMPLEAGAEFMLQAALTAGGRDNISLIVARIGGEAG